MRLSTVTEATYSDYLFWLDKSFWSIQEAAFIFAGIEPSSFTYWATPPFDSDELEQKRQFDSMLRLITSEKTKKQLPNGKILPIQWVAWAGKKNLTVSNHLKRAIDVWSHALAKAQNGSESNPKKNKQVTDNLQTKERNTLLKLIIGMAVTGYRYQPDQLRNSAVADIAKDIESLGLSIDEDTVRKWLKEASQILPRENQTSN